jgi:flagellar protein FlbD
VIRVTRINQQPLVLNSDLIEHIEATPDTVITMMNGQKLVVAESADALVEKVIAFRRSIQRLTDEPESGPGPEK